MGKGYALVTDFDGTISADDFFNMVASCFLDEKALAPWQEYLSGRKSHFDALKEIFSGLKILSSEKELREAVLAIPVDPAFAAVAGLCRQRGIPIYICSAGCDYYIKLLIGDLLQKYSLHLVTNSCLFTPGQGLLMHKPAADDPFFDKETGISKAAVVRQLKADGFKVVYAGDGRPDLAAAQAADVVFARKTLLELCRRKEIKTKSFPDFNAVYSYLEEVSR